MNRAFNERVLFERVTAPIDKTDKSFIGLDKSKLVKIKILDWGTHRDGTPFENESYVKNTIAYIKQDSMGIDVGNGTWLIERGYILGFE